MLTKKQVEKYLKDSSRCPKCGSRAISGNEISIEGDTAVQELGCYDCSAEWEDTYTLTGVAEI
jgi:DNA-directed RNA polymerase subunit RPC12/RpoP